MAHAPLPEELELQVAHCGAPLQHKLGRSSWSGEYEHTSIQFACKVCGLEVTVAAVQHVGPPTQSSPAVIGARP